eukprot:6203346-Pleurochrysis_carterae.AAC.1
MMGGLGDAYTVCTVGGIHWQWHEGRVPVDVVRHRRCHSVAAASRTCMHRRSVPAATTEVHQTLRSQHSNSTF